MHSRMVTIHTTILFLNTSTFNLDPTKDFDAFGLDTLIRRLGDVTMGIDKSVGKSPLGSI